MRHTRNSEITSLCLNSSCVPARSLDKHESPAAPGLPRVLSPDGADPVVPLLLAGRAQLIGLVFALHHSAFVLRLAGLDLLSFGVI